MSKKLLDYGQSSGSCRSAAAGYVQGRAETAVFQVWICSFAQEKGHQARVVFEDGDVQRRWLVVARGRVGTGTVLNVLHFKSFTETGEKLLFLRLVLFSIF